MALTKISTDGVKDDAITKAKIPADQIEASELANNAVDTNAIADQAVTLAKLPHGDSNNDGKFLRANNGADPTWETVSTTPEGTTILSTGESGAAKFLREDGDGSCSWQSIPAGVGGGTGVDFNDDVKARFGTGNDLEIYHDANDSIINDAGDGELKLQRGGSTKFILTDTGARVENTSSPLTSANSNANEFVVTGDGATGITIHSTATNQNTSIYFADDDSTTIGTIAYKHSNDQMRFNVDGGLGIQLNSDKTVYFQNTIYASGFSTGSDLTHKSNLIRFTDTLNKLKEIVGYKFDMKVGEFKDATISSAGIIAQDVEKVFPELVEGEEGGKTVQYNGLIGVLIEAVNELSTKVETLETKIAALEAA